MGSIKWPIFVLLVAMGHKDPKTVMRYDHHRENLDLNAVNYLSYDEKAEKGARG